MKCLDYTLKDLKNRGIILLNTMIVLFIFSSIFMHIVYSFQLQIQSSSYLEEAKEQQEIEIKILRCVVDANCYDLSFYLHDSQVEIYFLDTEVTVDIFGKYNFTIEMILDLDNFHIIHYNYSGTQGGQHDSS